ncbi:hypothetical protein B0A50_05540 [Salinomyces thailandicus]|uniref:HAD-superfamily hydrolase n=1 Tax=Salinomyces thailandicus TaxID=706561 RepID=A0A4U0TUT4_9PEZI|nr:hypothetical protein B0A50_05540 [Salinomyces thailandica]
MATLLRPLASRSGRNLLCHGPPSAIFRPSTCLPQRRTFQTAPPPTTIPDYAFAFDIDGVLLHSSTPVPGASETLHDLRAARIPFILLTNGGGTSETARVADLSAKLNLDLDLDQFIQSHTPFADIHEYHEKTVLVIGGDYDNCARVAREDYGFQNVVTPADLITAYPDIWPFAKVFKDYYAQFARPLPPHLTTQKSLNPNDHPLTHNLKIDAIFVYNDPRDWALDLTLTIDLLLSHAGHLGTLSPLNNNSNLPNNGYQQDSQPPLLLSNPDLWWSSSYHLPRLGQGGFHAALRGLWSTITNNTADLQTRTFGKPMQGTYEFAERRLRGYRKKLFGQVGLNDPLRRVYMVGDNPASDIRGANGYVSPFGSEWKSVLVKTGVYREGTSANGFGGEKPTKVLQDVTEAVRWGMEDAEKARAG